MNKAILSGRLATEPSLSQTTSGKSRCTFRLAVPDDYTDGNGQRVTDFLNVVAWQQAAELCAKYLTKGRMVEIEGKIKPRQYEAQDGSRHWTTEIVVEKVHFLPGGRRQEEDAPPPPPDGFVPVDDEEMPF